MRTIARYLTTCDLSKQAEIGQLPGWLRGLDFELEVADASRAPALWPEPGSTGRASTRVDRPETGPKLSVTTGCNREVHRRCFMPGVVQIPRHLIRERMRQA